MQPDHTLHAISRFPAAVKPNNLQSPRLRCLMDPISGLSMLRRGRFASTDVRGTITGTTASTGSTTPHVSSLTCHPAATRTGSADQAHEPLALETELWLRKASCRTSATAGHRAEPLILAPTKIRERRKAYGHGLEENFSRGFLRPPMTSCATRDLLAIRQSQALVARYYCTQARFVNPLVQPPRLTS